MLKINKKVVSEEDVVIRGKTYRKLTYDDGEIVLKIFDKKCKMWITSRFANGDDSEVIKNVIDTAIRVLV